MKIEKITATLKQLDIVRVAIITFLILFGILFLIGKSSPTYEPDPIIEGRLLSDWANDIQSSGWQNSSHEEAVDVLRRNSSITVPIFIIWLKEQDTFPQSVYFFTMSLLEGKSRKLLDYRGSYFNQLAAARALYEIEDDRPEVLEALRAVLTQYEGSMHYAAQTANETLQKLEAQQDASSNH